MSTLATNLEAVTESNGYSQTIRKVQRRLGEIPDTTTLPAIFIYEGTEEKDDDHAIGKLRSVLPVVVVCLVTATRNERSVANAVLGDLTRAMGVEFEVTDDFGGTAVAILTERTNEVETSIARTPTIYIASQFDVQYSHLLGDQTRA
jgi:hypothetical protein